MSNPRVWGSIQNGNIEFINYSEVYRDGVINVIRKSFFQYEAVSIGCEVNKCQEAQHDLELLCLDVLMNSNVSIIAVESISNEVIGVALNVIQVNVGNSDDGSYFEKFRDTVCKSESAKSLMSYMIEMDAKFDCFEHYNVDALLEIMFLATLPEFGRRGIGRYLCLYSIELARELKNGNNLDILRPDQRLRVPQLVTALFTSEKSQKIGDKLKFTIHHIEPHKNFIFEGKSYADRIGDPDCVSKLVAYQI